MVRSKLNLMCLTFSEALPFLGGSKGGGPLGKGPAPTTLLPTPAVAL